MDGWTDGRTDGRTGGWMDGWLDRQVDSLLSFNWNISVEKSDKGV